MHYISDIPIAYNIEIIVHHIHYTKLILIRVVNITLKPEIRSVDSVVFVLCSRHIWSRF